MRPIQVKNVKKKKKNEGLEKMRPRDDNVKKCKASNPSKRKWGIRLVLRLIMVVMLTVILVLEGHLFTSKYNANFLICWVLQTKACTKALSCLDRWQKEWSRRKPSTNIVSLIYTSLRAQQKNMNSEICNFQFTLKEHNFQSLRKIQICNQSRCNFNNI